MSKPSSEAGVPKVHMYFAAFYGGHLDGLILQASADDLLPFVERELEETGSVTVYKLRMNEDGKSRFEFQQSKHVTVVLYDYSADMTRLARDRRAREAQDGR
jgi:hypothetical protein